MFAIGMLRASMDLHKARTFLEGRGLVVGLVLAVVLGVITPFCSCSSIPLFIGFVAAGIPLSITLTFLIASPPLVSETAAILIGDHFGWGVAGAYLIAGSLIAIVIGAILSRFDLDKWVEPYVFDTKIAQLRAEGHAPTLQERVDAAVVEVRDIFTKVWKWVIVGVAIGAAIHGWVPADFFARYAGGADNPFGVPLATLFGVPLYVNGGGVVPPIGEALWAKGTPPLGTVMALMMASIALSIPEASCSAGSSNPPSCWPCSSVRSPSASSSSVTSSTSSTPDPRPPLPQRKGLPSCTSRSSAPAVPTAPNSRSRPGRPSTLSASTPTSRRSPTTPRSPPTAS